MRTNNRPIGAAGRVAFVWIAGALLATAVGCEPRRIEPDPVDRIVRATQVEVEYRRLELPNGMKAILISDSEAERSAASLSVGMGSLSDPKNRPGMAHFLEHMLFLGTEKYPEPEGYQQFVTQHAGFTNAYTADDHTNYFFQVAHDGFPEALDRFSQFFAAPLFNPEYVSREVKAVDSEHSKNIENDTWRAMQVVRGAYLPDHPINRFSTGSLNTLGGVTRAEMLRFYEGHYSSNLMTLAVLGDVGLDALEEMVRERFSPVKNRNLPRPTYPQTYLAKKPALRVITVEPVADQRSMSVSFPLPPTYRHYKSKPLQLLSFLLGHEGEGSLLSLLKAENLATSLGAGGGESTADYASLDLRLGLTPEGLERYQDILAHIFSAIRYFREVGVPHYVYEENRIMADMNFRYRPKGRSSSRVTRLSALMQVIPLEELPEGAYLYQRFDPDLYGSLLAELTPDNMLVSITAQGLPTDRTERHYGARYAMREYTGEPYERLVNAPRHPAIRLPQANPFIPHVGGLARPDGPLKLADTSLTHLSREGLPPEVSKKLEAYRGMSFTGLTAFLNHMKGAIPPERHEAYLPVVLRNALPLPTRLIDDGQAKVWYLPDWRFRQPKAQLILNFRTGNTYATPRQAVLASLYQFGWAESLNEFGYPVKLAGLGYGLNAGKTGVELKLEGYSPRMLDLLRLLVERLPTVDISQEIFESIKERYRRGLQNQRFGQPYEQARYFRRLLLEDPTHPREALEAELESVTLEEVQAYARRLYDRVYLEGVVAGSLDPAAARIAISRALKELGSRPLPPAERVDERIRQLPRGADYVYTKRLDINNSLVGLGYQVGQTDPTLRGGHLIIGRALRDSFYFNMRTQQQLGYIVFSGMGQMKKTLSLQFLIQSGAYSADALMERVEAYIPQFVREFRSMPDAEFERHRSAVIEAKLQRPQSLNEAASRIMWIAFENDEKFDHVSEDIRAVEALTREEVNRMLERSLIGPSAKRLLIRLIGKDHVAGPAKGTPIEEPTEIRAAAAG
ncbi:MAG: insulinase family protein [SAR324 cluster bacterium]|nr:insulinase family protein [SAR324 cluster bacterium]